MIESETPDSSTLKPKKKRPFLGGLFKKEKILPPVVYSRLHYVPLMTYQTLIDVLELLTLNFGDDSRSALSPFRDMIHALGLLRVQITKIVTKIAGAGIRRIVFRPEGLHLYMGIQALGWNFGPSAIVPLPMDNSWLVNDSAAESQ